MLAATVVGVQVAYSVVTAASAGSTSSIEALLSSTATVTAMSTDLAKTIPGVTVQAPLMLDPSSAPTRAPTFAPSSRQPTKQTVTLAPAVETVVTSSPSAFVTPSPSAFAGVLNTVYVSQSVTSATLTAAQAQSSTFMSAFAAGIQNAVPGVTVTVTSVSAARRRLLASVVVSYIASSATASTSALTASLNSPSTIAAASASLVAAGYAGVSVSNPVFASTAGSGSGSTSGGSGTSPGVIAGATLGVLVPVLIGVALLVIYLVKPQLLGCKKKAHRATRPFNAPMVPMGTTMPHAATTAAGDSGGGIGSAPIAPSSPGFTTTAATVRQVEVEQVEIDLSMSYDDDGTLQQNSWSVDLENIYSTHNDEEDPQLCAANDMYQRGVEPPVQRDISSGQGGDVLPFVLPRPRRSTLEYAKAEVGQGQGQGQGQSNASQSQPTGIAAALPSFRRPRNFLSEPQTERDYSTETHLPLPSGSANLQGSTKEMEQDAGSSEKTHSSGATPPNSPSATWKFFAPPIPPPSPMAPPIAPPPTLGLFTPYRYLTSIQGDVDPIPRPSSPRRSTKQNDAEPSDGLI